MSRMAEKYGQSFCRAVDAKKRPQFGNMALSAKNAHMACCEAKSTHKCNNVVKNSAAY